MISSFCILKIARVIQLEHTHLHTYIYRHMGVHIRCTVVCRWDLFAKLNDDVDKSRLIASVADVNTVFDFQNVVFYFSIAGSHRMASVWIVDWFPFWQHAPLMPVVSPSVDLWFSFSPFRIVFWSFVAFKFRLGSWSLARLLLHRETERCTVCPLGMWVKLRHSASA